MTLQAFGLKELKIDATGTPHIESPSGGNLNITAATTTINGNLNVTGTFSGSGGSGDAANIVVADESEDTECFLVFTTDATGTVAPKTGSNLTFNSDTGQLTATSFNGTAASSNAVQHVPVGSDGTFFIPFVPNGSTSWTSLGKDTIFSFNPSSNLLKLGSIELSGTTNIITASKFTGDLIGDVLGDVTGNVTGSMNNIPISIGNNPSETDNVMIGNSINTDEDVGDRNVFIGRQAGNGAGDGAAYNIGLGYKTLDNANGGFNIAMGRDALSGGGGQYNIAIGDQLGLAVVTGATKNILIGYQSGKSLTTCDDVIAIGSNSLDTITEGRISGSGTNLNRYGHIAIGSYALQKFQGLNNDLGNMCTAVGYNALATNVQGASNTAFGGDALRYLGKGQTDVLNTGAFGNTAVGHGAIEGGWSGDWDATNTFRGDYNTAIGWLALSNLKSGTSDNNTAIGRQAGDNITTGSNNTCIGASSDASSATATNEITLGDSNISSLRCNDTSISSLSDRRDKTDIVDLPAGLDFLNTLRPVKFKWQTRDGNGKDGLTRAGFIAQDLQSAQTNHGYLDLVMDNNPDKLEAKQEHLIPVLVKAIQELNAKIDKLESQIQN